MSTYVLRKNQPIDFSNVVIDTSETGGAVLKFGTSSAPVTADVADLSFIKGYFDNGATSGDNRGLYFKLDLTGSGTGSGEAGRFYTDVKANIAGAHGVHASLGFLATAGSSETSGLGAAVRGTLHIPNVASWAPTGTLAAGMFEVYNDGANSDPAGLTELSVLRLCNSGNATGAADVDDDAFLLSLQGWTAGAAKMFATGLTAATVYGNLTASLKIKVGSTTYYIPLATAIA